MNYFRNSNVIIIFVGHLTPILLFWYRQPKLEYNNIDLLSRNKLYNKMSGRSLLKRMKYFRELGFVHGVWKPGSKGRTFPILNPSTGETIANVADFDKPDVMEAIESSNDAFQKWRYG